jgi:hypothetical protein
MFDTAKIKSVALSYFRAAAASAVALYTAGQHDPKTLATAFLAGLVGPILKALDASAPEFGRGSK